MICIMNNKYKNVSMGSNLVEDLNYFLGGKILSNKFLDEVKTICCEATKATPFHFLEIAPLVS